MANTIFGVLKEQLQQRRDDVAQRMVRGVKTFEEYHNLVGQARAYELSIGTVEELELKQLGEVEDDDADFG